MGGKKGGSARTPVEAPDTLKSAQKLRLVGIASVGEIQGPEHTLKNLYFDRTPVMNADGSYNFNNVEVEYTVGTQDQDPLKGFNYSEKEISVGTTIKKNLPTTRTITDKDVSRLRITLGVRSLFQQKDNGDTVGSSVSLLIKYGDLSKPVIIDGKSSSQYLRHIMLENLPPVPFRVTVERLTEDSKSQRLQNETFWGGYTEIIDAKLSYPNVALAGFSFDSRQISNIPDITALDRGMIVSVPSNYDPITRKYNGFWDGSFVRKFSNNPAWVFYDVVTRADIGLGERLGVYGCDKFAMYAIAQYCDQLVPDGYGGKEPRMTCNIWQTEQRDAYDIIYDLASIMRGMPVWDGSMLTVVQDRPGDPVCTYTQANTVSGFKRAYSALKDRHTAVEVEFADKDNHYESTVEYVADDALIERYGYNSKKVVAYGCTSRGQAHRHGKWILETERLEVCTITFTVGAEGLRNLPGDIIEIADNHFAGTNIGGRVESINGMTVTLDREIDFTDGIYFCYAAVIDNALASKKIKVRSVSADKKTVTLDSAPAGLEPLQQWTLNQAKVSTQLYRAINISENSEDGTFTITALQHEPQKESIVDNGAHFEARETTLHRMRPAQVTHSSIAAGTDGIILTWEQPTIIGTVTYEVKLYKDGKVYRTYTDLKEPKLTFEGLPDGSYTAEIRAKNQLGQYSNPVKKSFEINLTITDLRTTSELMAINVEWTLPVLATVGNATEIWHAREPNLSSAVKISTLAYPATSYVKGNVGLSEKHYFWVRLTDKNGNKGSFTEAVFGEADHNPDNLVNYLNGQITETALGKDLIAQLTGFESGIEGLGNDLLAETRNRSAQILAEAQARSQAIAAEATKRSAEVKAAADKAAKDLLDKAKELGTQISTAQKTADNAVSTTTTLTAKLDNLSVGGRNYFLNTANISRTTIGRSSIEISPDFLEAINREKVLTLSVDAEVVGGVLATTGYNRIITEIRVRYEDGTIQYHAAALGNGSALNYKGRLSVTSTIQDKVVTSVDAGMIQIAMASATKLYIGKAKLEIGNLATDWTPAPEDNESAIGIVAAAVESEKSARAEADKAEAKARETLAGRVGRAEADLTEEKRIRIEADEAQAAESKKLGARLGTAESTLTKLNETVTNNQRSAATQFTEMNSKFDNLSVGGRNLLLSTGKLTDSKLWIFSKHANQTQAEMPRTDDTLTLKSTSAFWVQYYQRSSQNAVLSNELIPGKTYTISFEAKVNTLTVGYIRFFVRQFFTGGYDNVAKYFTASEVNKWEMFSYTFTLQDKHSAHLYWQVIFEINNATPGQYEVRKLKLERGNVATDWTPAPEDTNAAIIGTNAKITALESTVATANQASATRFGTIEASLGASGNLLQNSEFLYPDNRNVPEGYTLTNASGITGYHNLKNAQWTYALRDEAVFGIRDNRTNAENPTGATNSYVNSIARFPVRAGQILQFSCYVTGWGLRANSGDLLYLDFRGSNGTTGVSKTRVKKGNYRYPSNMTTIATGKFGRKAAADVYTSTTQFEHFYFNEVIPDGVDFVNIGIAIRSNFGTDSYLFCCLPQLCEVSSLDAPLIPYTPGSSSAKITTLQSAVATDKQATATKITAMQSSLNNATAKITDVQKTVADVGGKLSATRTLKTEAIAGGRTAIAGIAMGATADNKTVESSVIVMANKFGVVKNASDGNVINMLTVVDNKVAINGSLVAKDSILGTHIRAGQTLTSPNINGGQATIGTLRIGSDGSINSNNGNFLVDKNGNVTARSGTFHGTVYARNIVGDVVKVYSCGRNKIIVIPAMDFNRSVISLPFRFSSKGGRKGAILGDEGIYKSGWAKVEIKMNGNIVYSDEAADEVVFDGGFKYNVPAGQQVTVEYKTEQRSSSTYKGTSADFSPEINMLVAKN
ncbi:TipJ family phage tail tip protein [Testudinibacter sp. P80/BLE/0925]|uniref:TipJ family phage tail tip protein n=1 Tax=Testudinibacter sp. TW-1 TaxID=3417757 RepID=UPI003D36607A